MESIDLNNYDVCQIVSCLKFQIIDIPTWQETECVALETTHLGDFYTLGNPGQSGNQALQQPSPLENIFPDVSSSGLTLEITELYFPFRCFSW